MKRFQLNPILILTGVMAIATCGGRIWPLPTILEWLTQIGFTNLRSSHQRLGI